MDSQILPNPVFEGSEKRLELNFSLSASSPAGGLRALTRQQLDELMTLAHCTIVSTRSNAQFDAYVLSESSLFVYPTKWVLKTCGTTRLLNSVPRLLEVAADLGMEPSRCKFTRASFLFPEHQHFPHTSFEDEARFLDQQLGARLGAGNTHVLGEEDNLQWHVYISGAPSPSAREQPTYNLEVCMTELGLEAAQQFFRTEKFVSAEQTTKDTGILYLKPRAIIDDYVFEPCGYSMNGIENTGFITIHVTPEAGFSYASVEISGFYEDIPNPCKLLAAVSKIFQPGKVSVALSVDDRSAEVPSWDELCQLPSGYGCHGAHRQLTDCGGHVSYYTLYSGYKMDMPGSPTTTLHHAASFLSCGPSSSDNDADCPSDPETPSLSSGSDQE